MSLNSLYSTPLHGVELVNSLDVVGSSKSTSLPFKLEIDERTVRTDASITLIWSLTDRGERYQTKLELFQVSESEYILDIECEGKGRFYISPDKISINWIQGTDSTHYFQTLAMAIWLELNNVLCIHANALVKDNKTIALIGPSGMGKSTLSAYLQSQGYTWLTDDMLAIHTKDDFKIYPSWPKARMWPDSVQQVTKIDTKSLNKVHNNFSKLDVPLVDSSPLESYNLHAIYTLNRNGVQLAVHNKNVKLKEQLSKHSNQSQGGYKDKVSVVKMQSSQAIITLVQNSMLGSAYEKLVKTGKRLDQIRLESFAKLLNKLPIKQINYPNSFECLTNIKNVIDTDLQI